MENTVQILQRKAAMVAGMVMEVDWEGGTKVNGERLQAPPSSQASCLTLTPHTSSSHPIVPLPTP